MSDRKHDIYVDIINGTSFTFTVVVGGKVFTVPPHYDLATQYIGQSIGSGVGFGNSSAHDYYSVSVTGGGDSIITGVVDLGHGAKNTPFTKSARKNPPDLITIIIS